MIVEYLTAKVKAKVETDQGLQTLNDWLNERGSEGWDLVHIFERGRYSIMLLKRPVAQMQKAVQKAAQQGTTNKTPWKAPVPPPEVEVEPVPKEETKAAPPKPKFP